MMRAGQAGSTMVYGLGFVAAAVMLVGLVLISTRTQAGRCCAVAEGTLNALYLTQVLPVPSQLSMIWRRAHDLGFSRYFWHCTDYRVPVGGGGRDSVWRQSRYVARGAG